MLPAKRTSPGVVCGLFLALLLLLHGGNAVGDRAGEAGEGETGETTGEEREEQGSLGDRSAQIIRQQDAEEGRGNREDTAWSPNTDAFYSEPEVAEPKADTVNIVQDPSLLPDADNDTLCPKPTAPANGYITGHNYDDGGVVHIHCLAGYTLSGPSNLTCIPVPHPDAPGIWLPQDEYKCLPAKPSKTLCSKPEPPENGYITGRDYDYEGVVHVHCEEGYVLSGPSNITCLPVPFPGAPGVWVPQDEYRCLPADDGTIEIHTLGDDDSGAGPRYTVIGGDTNNYSIGQEHTESETLAETEDISCGKPAAPEHGQVEGSDHSMGATIHYVCDDGYTLFGPDHAACLPVPDPFHHVAIWEPPNVPTCKENPPSTLPLMLLQEASMARVYQPSSHQRTDSQPNADQVEGLPSACSLPVVAGPCRAAIQRYYFDTSLLECRPFRYGGCKGNDNNFETYDACQKTCR